MTISHGIDRAQATRLGVTGHATSAGAMRMRKLGLGLIALLATVAIARVSYSQIFPKVTDVIGGPQASPYVLGPFGDDPPVVAVSDWEMRRAPLLRSALAQSVYGEMPPALPSQVLARTPLVSSRVAPGTRMQQLTIGFGDGGDRGRVNVVLVQPGGSTPPKALIIIQNFCGNAVAVRNRLEDVRSLTDPPGPCRDPVETLSHIILGRYPHAPPLSLITSRGYAVAMVYAGDLVPDDPRTAQAALTRLYGHPTRLAPGGALAAWAWLYSALGQSLNREPGLQDVPVVAWGHSRNGKAALLGAATDPHITAVIAHQSGRGGAALTRSKAGESVAQITKNFGYWFTPRFATYAGREDEIPVDQHQLLALISPRPVLIGSGDRDAWSDPAGAFRAMQAASPVYELYGAQPFEQPRMAVPDLAQSQAFFMRRGTHGVTTEDWTLFLQFLDAHFPEQT
jgi:hypothetical protein